MNLFGFNLKDLFKYYKGITLKTFLFIINQFISFIKYIYFYSLIYDVKNFKT